MYKLLVIVLAFLFFAACEERVLVKGDGIYQLSVIGALLQGDFQGNVSVGSLAEHGDFGLGTLNALDGELMALNGVFYSAKANGHVESVNANELTPFVTLKFFVEDSMIRLHRKLTLAQLCDTINLVFGNVNRPFALRIDGEFASVRTRSFEPQQKPYKPMVDIMDSQKFTNFENVRGTLIGFRVPQYLADLNVPGFHFHFITDAKDMGGHVLDCTIENVRIGIDWADDLTVSFPHTGSFAGTDLNVNQRSALDRVER